MIARHLLDQRPAAVVLEHDEVPHQRQEPTRLEDALQHHLQLGHVRVGQRLSGDRAPRLEPLPPRRQRAHPRLVPVRHHQRLVHGEQGGQLGLVGLELLPRRPDGGVLVRRVLQLDHPQRQPVHEQHHVRPARVPVLGDCELVDRQPVVVDAVLEVDDPHDVAPHRAPGLPVLDLHSVYDHPVKGPVTRLHRRPLRPRQLPKSIVHRIRRQPRVQLRQCAPQAPPQHHLPIVTPLGPRRVWRDIRPMRHPPAEGRQPIKRRLLDFRFCESGHEDARRSP